MKKIIVLALLLVLLVAAVLLRQQRGFDTMPQSDVGAVAPGTYEQTVITSDGERKFFVHVPAALSTPDIPVPAVLFYHGGGGSAKQAIKDYGWVEKSEAEGFIAVFMQGTGKRQWLDALSTWNAGNCCHTARDNNVDDVAYTSEVIDALAAQFPVDTERVFVTGFSNGAMMSYRVACELGDRIAGVGAVAGTDNTTECNPIEPVPLLHIHALDDNASQFDGGRGYAFIENESYVTDFTSVSDSITKWRSYNDVAGEPERILDESGVYCDRFGDAAATPVILCVTDTGGHSWPGGAPGRVSGAVPTEAIDATDTIWEFFTNTSN